MTKTSSYHDALIESLADPEEAKCYLKAVLEDYPEGFLKALRNVAQANQMKKVAEAAGIKRESLYRALSDEGNPTWDTLTGILGALGLKFSITTSDANESGNTNIEIRPGYRETLQ
jgi:probable addiction module antidote protein